MGQVLGPDRYDAMYREDPSLTADAHGSTFSPLWREMARRVLACAPERVVELGCGAGQLAQLLHAKDARLDYFGIDFSAVAIELAQRRVPSWRDRFGVADIENHDIVFSPAPIYVACETLEHVADMRAVLRRCTPGAYLIASLPSRDSEGHVRWWTSGAQLWRHLVSAELGSFTQEVLPPMFVDVRVQPFGQWWIVEGWIDA